MTVYLHGINGKLHSWTSNPYISSKFRDQRERILHTKVQVKEIKVKKYQKDAFLDRYGRLKLCPFRVHNDKGESDIYVTDLEKAFIDEYCHSMYVEALSMKGTFLAMGFGKDILESVDDAAISIPFMPEEGGIIASGYEISAQMNTINAAIDWLQQDYREGG